MTNPANHRMDAESNKYAWYGYNPLRHMEFAEDLVKSSSKDDERRSGDDGPGGYTAEGRGRWPDRKGSNPLRHRSRSPNLPFFYGDKAKWKAFMLEFKQ